MKIQGLVFLVALCLSRFAVAQTAPSSSADVFLPPSPSGSDAVKATDPLPQPTTPAQPNAPDDIESELKQFRNELRDFQTMREEVARSTKTTDADADRIAIQQRQELVELLTKLANKAARLQRQQAPYGEPRSDGDATNSRSMPPTPPVESTPEPPISSTLNLGSNAEIADPFALGKILFRSGDFVGAERAFRRAAVDPENEMTLKYLMATCIRRQSRWKEAVALYKVIADSNHDPVLRDLAKWQIDNIRWVQDSESQLDKLRRQRDTKAKTTNSQPADMRAGK